MSMEERRMFEFACDKYASRADTVRVRMNFEEAVWLLRRIADELEPGIDRVCFSLYGRLEDKGKVARPVAQLQGEEK